MPQDKQTAEQFDRTAVLKLYDSIALVESKKRHFVCIQVFKSHCVAVYVASLGSGAES